MTFYDEEELKNLFTFLTQKGLSNSYVVSKESLLFGMKMVSLELRMRDHTTLKINLESINLGRLKDFIDYARSLYR